MSLKLELVRLAKSNPDVRKEVLAMLKTAAKSAKKPVPTSDMRKAYYDAADGITRLREVTNRQDPYRDDVNVDDAVTQLELAKEALRKALEPYAWD